MHATDSTGASELSEDDLPSPTEANASTEKNVAVATEEDRSVAGKVDKNVSTEFDANNCYAIEKKIVKQQELIEMLQDELRATRPSNKLQDDDKQVHFYTGLPHHIQYLLHYLTF